MVLINDNPTRSCITQVGTVSNKEIVTIEGLEKNGKLHPVQEAFLSEQAFQCAYCTSGMVIAAVALLNRKNNPTDAEIVEGMNGNICRCCTYPRIFSAVRKAASQVAAAR